MSDINDNDGDAATCKEIISVPWKDSPRKCRPQCSSSFDTTAKNKFETTLSRQIGEYKATIVDDLQLQVHQ